MCHNDQSPRWAADVIAKWYGEERFQGRHYGETIAAGRGGADHALDDLKELIRDTEQPAIVRATALELLAQYGEEADQALNAATKDKDPLVRATAVGTLGRLPGSSRLFVAGPLLNDPVRAVRIEAARVLSSVRSDLFEPGERLAYEASIAEYKETQIAGADGPAAHLNLAVIHTSDGRFDLAEQSYLTAIRLDPDFLPARINLANLYKQTDRNDEAEQMFRDALERAVPADRGELHYSLGLLLAEQERLEEAVMYLEKAADSLPRRGRVRYNYALALQHLGRDTEAEIEMLKAHSSDPTEPGIVNALAVFYIQRNDWEKALPYAQKFVALEPDAPVPRQMLQRIQQELSHGNAR
jgi:tetratricopeptide (TPR) repeat protein